MVGKIHNLPTSCPCGSEFDIQYSMSCKKGGSISIGHNDLGNLTANVMSEVCKDTEIEPKLTPVPGEELWNVKQLKRGWAHIKTRGFWERGQ